MQPPPRGYASCMREWTEPTAPDLGTPTDSTVDEAAATTSTDAVAESDSELTMDPPDKLGGTGGEQAGGAG